MPPYQADPNRVMWQRTSRTVRCEQVDLSKPKSWRVVVSFHRSGMRVGNQERVSETLEEFVVHSGLGPQQADCLKRTIQGLCDATYAQGYSAARSTP